MSDAIHTSSAFEQDLVDLNMDIVRLGKLASRQLNACLRAMSDFQVNKVDLLIEQDIELDRLEAQINDRVLSIITMRAPRADDLRRVLAAAKTANDLERIGDYARNTAKRTKAVMTGDPVELPWDMLIEMGTMVAAMIDDVLLAYQQGDIKAAQAIRNSDVHIDKLNTNFLTLAIEKMDDNNVDSLTGTHLIFMAKNLERIGDFTTGIAEQVHFIETGIPVDADRPKADRTSWMIANQ
ncbi:MAG: phosphate signaling complex protein PhoU [Bacteroidetes bacterium]|jgi:phosphate transport system protein|nr:phosphate signaling complex protein PhoU [Bacteroidota bacterium]